MNMTQNKLALLAEPLALLFNAGLNDAWYNPDTDGSFSFDQDQQFTGC